MTSKQGTVFIVDDDTNHRTMLKVNLKSAGFATLEAGDGDEVLPALTNRDVDVILLDLKMKRIGGIATLANLLQNGITIPVIVITAFSSVESAVDAMKKGAFDYITKPIDVDELKLTISRAINFRALNKENKSYKNLII